MNSLDEVTELMELGEQNRSSHATDMNEHSSRSHSMLSVYVASKNTLTGEAVAAVAVAVAVAAVAVPVVVVAVAVEISQFHFLFAHYLFFFHLTSFSFDSHLCCPTLHNSTLQLSSCPA